MSFFDSHVHKDLRSTRLTKRGATARAEDVPRGTHKSYPRMEQLPLPAPKMLDTKLQEVLERRSSYFGGTEHSKLSLEDCGTLFGLALGKRRDTKNRNYPSGGALYPIETYVISSAIGAGAPAVFHYDPSAHSLEKLWDVPADIAMKDLARHPEDMLFSSLVVFTSVWKRSSAKYGDFTYTLAMLEAGHMSENVILVATALSLNARPYAGFSDDLLIPLLDLDPEEEQPVHAVVLC